MTQGPTTYGGEKVSVIGKKGGSKTNLGAPNKGGQNSDRSIGSSPKASGQKKPGKQSSATYGQ